ncbi:capsular polysaccharide biosynthesis protein [Microbulbifer epialgicus]|uniref:Capsular polysaccharide biosynthesis protein n=1 Tax=Microbulbifer epialgicus TaxID=393907 RepID=A0ABV4P3P8_9GAMM
MIGWGLKATAIKAKKIAARVNLPFISVEDGFLRSLGLGVNGALAHSLAVDKTGIYYDSSKPSDLETLILEAEFSSEELERAEEGMELLRTHKLCKYNQSIDSPFEFSGKRAGILVVDQTFGDVSVRAGQASERHFREMLEAAIEENSEAEIFIKVHPDVIAGRKRGYLWELASTRGCRIISENFCPWSIFDQVDKVYVVTSQLGFDALVAGKEVHCFGLPFYAGWGLTKDRQNIGRRNVNRTLSQVFFAAYLRYCRYINPYTGQRCEFEDTVALIGEQKRQWQRFQGSWVGVGFSPWKKSFIPSFVGAKRNLTFVRKQKQIAHFPENTNIFIWASRVTDSLYKDVNQSRQNLWRVEDGFLRSTGLGADLVAPISLVFDASGIYFDARSPNDLETILSETAFSEPLLKNARDLHSKLLCKGVTKYNIGGEISLPASTGRRIILVPGQVESDASIAHGSPIIKSNLSLLKHVREANPDAYIIYKPHPDVVAGARHGALPKDSELIYDTFIADGDISLLLDQVDEVHTMSSLTGFEALLRNIKVVTYGLPFYAGWGLSEDLLLSKKNFAEKDFEDVRARRSRKLNLHQLIAGALILYPIYVDPRSGDYIDVSTTIELFDKNRSREKKSSIFHKVFCWYRSKFLRY